VSFPQAVEAPFRRIINKPTSRSVMSFVLRKNLSQLALMYGTDKQGRHRYAQHYQHHFEPWRRKKLNILEIGIGGYINPNAGGRSLRMWKAYFPNSRIFGIDIYDKTPHDAKRIKTFQGSQTDTSFLKRVVEEIGRVDIIIDDGSHHNEHVITSFKFLFPLLTDKGIYVVEDTQTSYWSTVQDMEYGGSSDLTAPHTSMNYLKSLTDGLNHEEFTSDEYTPTYFDKHITAMHFYHNLVFVYKGFNNEGSNVIAPRHS
jgi:hypothetical protein